MNGQQRNILFLIVLSPTVLVSATPLSRGGRSTPSTFLSSEESTPTLLFQRGIAPNCSIDGNQDLYGIGVRSGIYLQAWASLFTLAFGFDTASNALSTNIWFQVALFIALVYTSAMKTIYASEAVIAMLLLALLQIFDAMLICSTVIHVLSARFLRSRSRLPEMVELKSHGTIIGHEDSGTFSEGRIAHERHDWERGEGSQTNPETPTRANEEIPPTDADPPAVRQRKRKLEHSIRARQEPPDFSGDLFQLVKDDFKDEAELASIIEKLVYYIRNGNLFSCCIVALLILAGVMYATWFWWIGIRLDIFGWVRWPARIFLVITLLIFGCLYLLWIPIILLVQVLISEIVFYRCGGTFGARLERQYPVLRLRRTFYNRIIEAKLVPKTKFIGSLLMLAALLIAQLNDLFATQDTRTQRDPRTEAVREQEQVLIIEPANGGNTGSKIDTEAQNITEMDITETTGMEDEITPVHDATNSEQVLIVTPAQEAPENSIQRHGITAGPPCTQPVDKDQSALIGIRRIPESGSSRISRLFDRVEDKIEAALSMPLGQEVSIHPSRPVDIPKQKPQVPHAKSCLPCENNTDAATIPVRVFLAHAPIFPLFSLYFLFCVVSIELTISANKISGVNELPSASQLIPFIIGLASIFQNGFSLMLNVAGILDVWLQARRGLLVLNVVQ